MFSRRQLYKLTPISIGFLLVLFVAWLQITSNPTIQRWVNALNNLVYDVQLRTMHPKASVDLDSPIVVVTVDDKSLTEEGRWPWPRNKIAKLIKNLQDMGVAVIAMDMTFPEPEMNIAKEMWAVMGCAIPLPQALHQKPEVECVHLKSLFSLFDYDQQFADVLKQGETVLGVTFHNQPVAEQGILSPSVITSSLSATETQQLAIPVFQSYTSNISPLQTAVKGAGFVNAFPDEDGVMRHALLVARFQDKIYPSLALEAIRRYTFTNTIQLITAPQGKQLALQGLQLGNQTILTDAIGRVLIPFRGTAYSFPYFSAADILARRVPPAALKDKLVFVGATAFGLGDLHATAVQSVYPGVEVHANVAAGILNNYFPTRPAWASGAELVILLFMGLTAAVLFPFLGAGLLTLIASLLSVLLIIADGWLWQAKGIVLTVFLSVALIILLAVFNMAYGYLFENRRREQLRSMFGQYVPTAHVDAMLADRNQYSFQGQSKEMTVLFADIRNFTAISEKMTAAQLKNMLNQYLTPMTEILFKHQGTIDKYVGDMVMAFWNAPLNVEQHARHAVLAALEMQAAVSAMQDSLAQYTIAPVHIGIGINTGVMNVGDMGSEFRRAYTVLGDAVNLASRLEGQTKYYSVGVIVGEETYAQTQSEFLFRQLDRIKVKGKITGVTIYEPICLLHEATNELQQRVQAHQTALNAYFAQQWDIAETGFKQLLAASNQQSEKHLYTLYLNRIQGLRANPPGADWDGAYISLEK